MREIMHEKGKKREKNESVSSVTKRKATDEMKQAGRAIASSGFGRESQESRAP